MPSERPNFILRGARLATIGVNRPTRSSGLYADLMPAKTVRWRPSPTSSVNLISLSAPSTCSALTMRAMRRSIFAKSSIEICATSFAAASGERACGEGRARLAALPAASSICFGSMRGHQMCIRVDTMTSGSGRSMSAHDCGGNEQCPAAARAFASVGSTGVSNASGRGNRRGIRAASCARRALAGSFGELPWLCLSKCSIRLVGDPMISRNALPNSRFS